MRWKLADLFAFCRDQINWKLGRCPKCMRWSLRGGVVTAALVIGTYSLVSPVLAYALLPVTAAFFLLWVLHILRFEYRFATLQNDPPSPADAISRRTLLRFASGAILGITVSAM